MNDKSYQFTNPFSQSREMDFWLETICAICAVGSGHPVLHIARGYATLFVRNPSLKTLRSLMDLQPDPSFMDERDVWVLRQLQALFSKRENLPGVLLDREAAALDSFWLAERMCRQMNARLRDRSDPQYADRGSLLLQMSRKISSILGPCPSLSDLPFAFGPGSNVGCKKNTSVKHKLQVDATATENAGRVFIQYLRDIDAVDPNKGSADLYHAWPGLNKPKAVRGSQWTSVPKSFKTERGINIEPVINSFIQKGIGSYIKKRLQKAGVNLRDQSFNQRLAREGSLHGDEPLGFCTIDLSMASDTISYNLVMDLLPWDWFCLLDSVRCAETQLPDGNWVKLEKFSPMGNAYTFELESLIFYALLLVTCGESPVSVYGDDMICQNMYYEPVCFNLNLCGFVPNEDKSFASGPFRESCGADFWNGYEVRPVFCKEDLCAKEIFRLHNFFVRRGWFDPEFMVDYVPSEIRLFGPDGYGDGHLLGDTIVSFHKGYGSLVKRFKSFSAKPRRTSVTATSELARYGAFLYGNKPNQCWLNDPISDVPVVRKPAQMRFSSLAWRPLLLAGESLDIKDLIPSETLDDVRSDDPKYVVRTLRVPAVT